MSLGPMPSCLLETGSHIQRVACSSRLGDQHGVCRPSPNAPVMMGCRHAMGICRAPVPDATVTIPTCQHGVQDAVSVAGCLWQGAGSSSGRIDDSRGNLAQEDTCRSGPWLSPSTARRGSGRNKPDMGFASQQLAANSGNLKQARDGDTQATTSRPTGSSAGLWRRDIRRLGRPSHQIKECAQGWCSCDAGGCGSGNHPVIPVIQCRLQAVTKGDGDSAGCKGDMAAAGEATSSRPLLLCKVARPGCFASVSCSWHAGRFRFAQHRWTARSALAVRTGQAVVGFWRESFPNRLTIAKTRLGLQGKGQGHHGAQTTHHPCSGRRRTRCKARCFETHGASPPLRRFQSPTLHFTSFHPLASHSLLAPLPPTLGSTRCIRQERQLDCV